MTEAIMPMVCVAHGRMPSLQCRLIQLVSSADLKIAQLNKR
jgi:hypothetical protein